MVSFGDHVLALLTIWKSVQANLGFAAQYAATNTDPITNLSQHLSDPTHLNFTTNHVRLPFY